MEVVREKRQLEYRKQTFEIIAHFYRCSETGEQFEDEAFAQLNYVQLLNQYRAKNRIPFPAEIQSIRKKYALSASKMAEILGFGINSYRQYENGDMPSESNARLIQLVNDPREFKKLVLLCPTLSDTKKEKLATQVDKMIRKDKSQKYIHHLSRYLLGEDTADRYTGFRKPDLSKTRAMVQFFADKMSPWTTQLNKLLFYADFLHFRETGFSITGLRYRAIPLGPVPMNYQSLFEYLSNEKAITKEFFSFDTHVNGEKFVKSNHTTFDPTIFAESEYNILQKLADRFAQCPTEELVQMSHQEIAWKENKKEQKLIDYFYGFELNLTL